MCILRLNRKTQYKPLPLNTKAERGDRVYAVGFPSVADALSDEIAQTSADATVTDGIISAIRTLTITKGGVPVSLYQISAPINHGNSGGPLLDGHGYVVGVNTYGVENAESVNGAISAVELLFLAEANGLNISTYSIIGETFSYIIGIFILVGVLFVAFFIKKRTSKDDSEISLRTYISNLPQALTKEQAVSLIMPIAIQLRNLHEDGKTHLQVSPDSIYIENGNAILAAPKPDEVNRYSNGFAAPEIYKGKNCGQQSDVYSLCSVLLYSVTGTIPSNALSREEDEILENEFDSAFFEVIKKGRQLIAVDRYSSMRELIAELSQFNFGIPLPTTSCERGRAAKKKTKCQKLFAKKYSKKQIVRFVSAIAIIFFFVLTAVYGGAYYLANRYANGGAFSKAQTFLLVPGLTRLHDPLIEKYLFAGQQFERADYLKAEESFASCGNYRNAAEYCAESRYQYAVDKFNLGEYSIAIEMLASLSEQGYKDANDYLLESKYLYAQVSIENNDFSEAIRLLDELSKIEYKNAHEMLLSAKIKERINLITDGQNVGMNYGQASALIVELRNCDSGEATKLTKLLKEATYSYACNQYKKGEYYSAREIFSKLSSYKDADKYISLCNLTYGLVSDSEFKKITNNIGFANTKTILLRNTASATRFLAGTWRTGDGYYYFSMQKNGKNQTSYNLPHLDLENSFYFFKNGIYSLESMSNYLESNEKKVFRFSILSANKIAVYCYKNGSTYTLYRQ